MSAQHSIGQLPPAPGPTQGGPAGAPGARALARSAFGNLIDDRADQQPTDKQPLEVVPAEQPRREAATESIGRRAGALSDELDFPEFVASLVHGTFDAIVDSSIRQMESFADLVAAVAKPIDQFAQENVSPNQVRDWLVEQYPKDLSMMRDAETFRLVPRAKPNSNGGEEPASPDWLEDFGLSGEELTSELLEERLLPLARKQVARNRLQTLATMVLLGMNRVIVRDGTIAARLRFRATAADHAKVDYAISDDPDGGGTEWGRRGSRTFSQPTTKVSTVGVNVQADSELKAELFGEVKINFASETVPLDRFVDEARRTLLERHAKASTPVPARTAALTPPVPGTSTPSGPVTQAPEKSVPSAAVTVPPPPGGGSR